MYGLAESGPFVCRCLNSRTMLRFHTPAYRTGQAQLTHPALGERFTLSPTENWRSARSGEPSQTSDAGLSGETACSPRPALCVCHTATGEAVGTYVPRPGRLG